jgi:hypothetical protein
MSLLEVGIFILDKEVNKFLIVFYLLLFNWDNNFNLLFEALQQLQEVLAVLYEVIDLLIVLLDSNFIGLFRDRNS